MARQLPEALADMIARLKEWGFETVAEDASDGFGDRSILLGKPPIVLRVVLDRGQWFLELSCDGWDDWFDPDVWKACLDDAPIRDEPSPLAEQAEYVVESLDRLENAARGSIAGLSACLRDKRAGRSRRRLGLDG